MKVATGSDHRGIEPRKAVGAAISKCGHEIVDLGTYSTESCDYPDIAVEVGQSVARGKVDRGILICGTGIGVSIAANKVLGVRAALCHDLHTAKFSRLHNDANVLCLSGDSLSPAELEAIVSTWLSTEFEGGRHQRRVDKISDYETRRPAPRDGVSG